MTAARTRMVAVGIGLVLLAVAAAAGPEAAWAHGDGPAHGHLSERALLKAETRLLGAAHAADHARTRRLERRDRRRWLQLSPAQRRATLKRQKRARARLSARVAQATDPATDGRWNGSFPVPVAGVHAIMLPTGKVMWFSRINAGGPENEATAWLWDPSKPQGDPSSLTKVDPPIDPDTGRPVNLWCAGQSLLPDGQVLVTGGNLAYATSANNYADYKGLNRIYTFDPWTERWTEQPRMGHGRWYPTQTLLPDGRTLIVSGRDETATRINTEIELFEPPAVRGGQGRVVKVGEYGSTLPGSPASPEYYPHWFVMPSGTLLNAGPSTRESWSLDLRGATPTSADRPAWARTRLYGTGVLLPAGPEGSTRVAQIGGFGAGGAATAETEVFDEATPATAPVRGPDLVQSRAHHNTVLLPDASMVSVGGGYGNVGGDLRQAGPEHLPIEIWDPARNQWRLGPAQTYKRAYHSTALLLPDGRVVSAGDDRDPSKDPGRRTDIAELYEPPYLFAPGERPSVTAAPGSVGWNQPFAVQTSSPVARAVLVAPGATTHANDMQQRHVELRIAPGAGGTGANLIAPPTANVAPPGWYMLFVLSPTGKPSVARWIQIGVDSASPEPPPPPAPPGPVACGDGIDNDGDGKVDRAADAGCRAPTDGSERGANRLGNAGFERDADRNRRPDRWSDTRRFRRAPAPKTAGSYSGRIRARAGRSLSVRQGVRRIAGGKRYRLRGDVRIAVARGNPKLRLKVRWVNARGRTIRTSTVTTLGAATRRWKRTDASLRAPARATRATVSVTSRSATSYIDAFWFGLA